MPSGGGIWDARPPEGPPPADVPTSAPARAARSPGAAAHAPGKQGATAGGAMGGASGAGGGGHSDPGAAGGAGRAAHGSDAEAQPVWRDERLQASLRAADQIQARHLWQTLRQTGTGSQTVDRDPTSEDASISRRIDRLRKQKRPHGAARALESESDSTESEDGEAAPQSNLAHSGGRKRGLRKTMSRRSRRALLAAENLSNEARAVSDSVPCVESEGVTPSRDSLQALMSCLAHINHARRASTLQLASRALSLAADIKALEEGMATRWAASDGSEIVSDLRSLLNTQDCFVADYREACHVFRIRPPPLTRFRSLVSVPIHRAAHTLAAAMGKRLCTSAATVNFPDWSITAGRVLEPLKAVLLVARAASEHAALAVDGPLGAFEDATAATGAKRGATGPNGEDLRLDEWRLAWGWASRLPCTLAELRGHYYLGTGVGRAGGVGGTGAGAAFSFRGLGLASREGGSGDVGGVHEHALESEVALLARACGGFDWALGIDLLPERVPICGVPPHAAAEWPYCLPPDISTFPTDTHWAALAHGAAAPPASGIANPRYLAERLALTLGLGVAMLRPSDFGIGAAHVSGTRPFDEDDGARAADSEGGGSRTRSKAPAADNATEVASRAWWRWFADEGLALARWMSLIGAASRISGDERLIMRPLPCNELEARQLHTSETGKPIVAVLAALAGAARAHATALCKAHGSSVFTEESEPYSYSGRYRSAAAERAATDALTSAWATPIASPFGRRLAAWQMGLACGTALRWLEDVCAGGLGVYVSKDRPLLSTAWDRAVTKLVLAASDATQIVEHASRWSAECKALGTPQTRHSSVGAFVDPRSSVAETLPGTGAHRSKLGPATSGGAAPGTPGGASVDSQLLHAGDSHIDTGDDAGGAVRAASEPNVEAPRSRAAILRSTALQPPEFDVVREPSMAAVRGELRSPGFGLFLPANGGGLSFADPGDPRSAVAPSRPSDAEEARAASVASTYIFRIRAVCGRLLETTREAVSRVSKEVMDFSWRGKKVLQLKSLPPVDASELAAVPPPYAAGVAGSNFGVGSTGELHTVARGREADGVQQRLPSTALVLPPTDGAIALVRGVLAPLVRVAARLHTPVRNALMQMAVTEAVESVCSRVAGTVSPSERLSVTRFGALQLLADGLFLQFWLACGAPLDADGGPPRSSAACARGTREYVAQDGNGEAAVMTPMLPPALARRLAASAAFARLHHGIALLLSSAVPPASHTPAAVAAAVAAPDAVLAAETLPDAKAWISRRSNRGNAAFDAFASREMLAGRDATKPVLWYGEGISAGVVRYSPGGEDGDEEVAAR